MSEKAPVLVGVSRRVLRYLQGQVEGGQSCELNPALRPQYERLGHVVRIAYRHAYKEFIDAQKQK